MSSSIIQRMIQSVFGNPEFRVLFLGLDATGRTTLLYKVKLGEVVATIPTIGFNVETVTILSNNLTIWDVGGCDKIRPLWRHYFQNTQGVAFFVDSGDHERVREAAQEIHVLRQQEELRLASFVVFATKQDLPSAMNVEQISDHLQIDPAQIFPMSVTTGEGVDEGMEGLLAAMVEGKRNQPPLPPPSDPRDGGGSPGGTKEDKAGSKEEELLTEWLEHEDEPDEEFLGKLHDYTLDSWDHRTHLRVAWLYLTKFGRREGMQKIFDGIKLFIENSPRTKRSRGTTFHETMTYFWVHMVHYSIETTVNPTGDFKGFLLMAPQLSNGGMFLAFYTKKHMLNNPEARTTVVLPDKRPLPSIISDIDSLKQKAGKTPVPSGDEEKTVEETENAFLFMQRFEEGSLRSWKHEYLIQIIATYLLREGRQAGVDKILSELQRQEGEAFHLTINYFWIQMVTYALETAGIPIARERTAMVAQPAAPMLAVDESETEGVSENEVQQSNRSKSSFNSQEDKIVSLEEECNLLLKKLKESAFYRSDLLDSKAWAKYYSDSQLFSEEMDAKNTMVLPDKSQLPSTVTILTTSQTNQGFFSKLF